MNTEFGKSDHNNMGTNGQFISKHNLSYIDYSEQVSTS